ncbi:MAG: acyl-CoA dehydrogenase [Gammaproteobacteria bacterium]|nr:acyl-CoA dehydrogenase [Gammaproteobacteria bacterium]
MMSFLLVVGVLLAAMVALLGIPALRRPLISNRILPWFRAALPPMSQTERDAIEAGTVWWEGDLFSGRPDWNKLLAIPAPKLSAEEQAFLDGPVEELCRMLNDWHITEELHDLPPHVWQFIKDNRFFGMIIPKKYGGLEFSALVHSAVVMKISGRSVAAGVTVMVPNSLGPAELLLHYGTEEQKNHYLPRLARGEEVPCFALTGPEAGSDASSIPDTGVVCRGMFQGNDVVGIRLNWDKRYITLGPVATVLGLAFKLYDPDGLLGSKKELGITCALIPTNTPGITIGNRHFPLNIPFQNGPNSGKDVFIPLDWIIGGAAGAGQGWRMLMESLAAGRSISLPAQSVGASKLACRATGAYARIRKQFKMPIGRFEGVEEALARIAGYTYMMDAARIMTAGAVDLGEKPSVVSAIVKYHLTERMRKVVNDAMDVQGGSGICMGPRNLLGRVYQSIPIGITVEGANILTRSLIIFGQGAVRAHPYVLKEMRAATDTDPQRASEQFDKAFFGHIGFTVSNAIRALLYGLTGASFAGAPAQAGPERHYYRQLTRMSAAFALVADASMLMLGGALKRKEKLSGRLADVLSQLYLASTVLKRFADQGRPAADLPLLQWACDDALHQMQEALDGLLRNLPNRGAAALLRLLVFPLGKPYAAPHDALGHKAASLLLEPSEARDRLTLGVYAPTDLAEPLGRLEDALTKTIAAEAVEKKLRAALNAGAANGNDEVARIREAVKQSVISEDEAGVLLDAIAARKEVIKVDDFAPEYWKTEEIEWPTEQKMPAKRFI